MLLILSLIAITTSYLVEVNHEKHQSTLINCVIDLTNLNCHIVNNDKIILTIELGAAIVKQSQFDILVGLIQDVSTKVDEVDVKVDNGFKEVKTILKKHDDLFVEHQWLKQSSF